MSFGLRDKDWVDPPEPEPGRCIDCRDYVLCPCGCGEGWCSRYDVFKNEEETCESDI